IEQFIDYLRTGQEMPMEMPEKFWVWLGWWVPDAQNWPRRSMVYVLCVADALC
ncbi:autoinducer 2 import ATP-binding LsrA domain protein, partial [Escherichia coli PA35]